VVSRTTREPFASATYSWLLHSLLQVSKCIERVQKLTLALRCSTIRSPLTVFSHIAPGRWCPMRRRKLLLTLLDCAGGSMPHVTSTAN
jgi:hypothetical protein